MKIGMNMLLWTGHVTEQHAPVLRALKDTGFDGVEIPLFDVSDEDHYRWLAGVLDDLGLERTVVALIPDEAHNPLAADAACRRRGDASRRAYRSAAHPPGREPPRAATFAQVRWE